MATAWYYSRNGVETGPVTSRELADLARSGQLLPTDFVWKEGITEWLAAGKVKGLFPTPAPSSSPVPTPAPPAPPAESSPPGVAAAANSLFGALTSAAKRVGARVQAAAEKATEPPAADDDPAVASPPAVGVHKLSKRTRVVAAVGGSALLLSCVVCGVVGFVVGPKLGGQSGLGVSQERLLRSKPDANLENMFGSFGCDPVLTKNDRDMRVWAFGKNNRLAATGPETNLTGVMVLQGFSTSESDNAVGVMLSLVVMAPILNPQFEAGGKWAEGDELLRWMTGLLTGKGSGVRVVNGRRVQFTVRAPLCSVLTITPEDRSVDPDDAIKLVLGK